MLSAHTRRRLQDVLEVAQAQGAIGPGPVTAQINHAITMITLTGAAPRAFVDLGSGAGLPGLVAALMWPEALAVFVEAQGRRTRMLEEAVARLSLERCRVIRARAEDVGREPEHREQYDLVLARAFGRPATTAECGAPLVRVGGNLVVAEPPAEDPDRWPGERLPTLGLGPPRYRHREGVSVAILRKVAPTDERWPRRPGVPKKRPLW